MQLTKQEFKLLVMLYAANIDGNIQPEETKLMLKKSDPDTFESVSKLFAKMNDVQVLDCIRENKTQFAATEADRLELITELVAIIEADEKRTAVEDHLVRTMKKILE